MSAIKAICSTVCYTCVAVSIASLLIPQKRTRRIMSFVLGLFFLSTFVTAFCTQSESIDLSFPDKQAVSVPEYSEKDMTDAAAQMTADNVTEALDQLLQNEGIHAEDIRITMKISDEGSITVVRAVIYISEAYSGRIDDIESIVYRNISKEPEIYVEGEKAR